MNLFWRQIGRGAHQAARAGHLRGESSDSEVTKFYVAVLGDQNICRLDVAVDNPGAMSTGQRSSQIGSPSAGAWERYRRFREDLLQRFPGYILHHQISDVPFFDADVVEVDDRRMRQLADNLRFAQELLLFGGRAKRVDQGLQRHRAPQDRVARFIDTAGGATA